MINDVNREVMTNNGVPDVYCYNSCNPTLQSPNSPYELSFAQTAETVVNTDDYRLFLSNAIQRFRRSRTYKNYKGFLMGLGMDRCQVHGNITDEMATIEMHHNMLTIFDIALIISEHTIATAGQITTFDLIEFLRQAHTKHKVQLVMLTLTPHQLYHNTNELKLPPELCIGDWFSFLEQYWMGITTGIARKIIYYLDDHLKKGNYENEILNVRQKLLDWSVYNDQRNSN